MAMLNSEKRKKKVIAQCLEHKTDNKTKKLTYIKNKKPNKEQETK